MKATLKRVHSPDIENLPSYSPEDSEKFSFLLQAMVGPEGKEGEESFDIEVCTPNWMIDNFGEEKVVLGLHRLILIEYDYEIMISAIERFLEGCSGDNWPEIAQKVSQLGRWEFENYS